MIWNPEHSEALQNEVDERRHKISVGMPEEWAHKQKVVDEAIRALRNAEIPFLLISEGYMNHTQEKRGFYQWNNLSDFAEEKDGKYTPEFFNWCKDTKYKMLTSVMTFFGIDSILLKAGPQEAINQWFNVCRETFNHWLSSKNEN